MKQEFKESSNNTNEGEGKTMGLEQTNTYMRLKRSRIKTSISRECERIVNVAKKSCWPNFGEEECRAIRKV